MKVEQTPLAGLLVLTPNVFTDERGYFFESYNDRSVPPEVSNLKWVQDNESKSTYGVLRGIHYQVGEFAQTKLVRAITGIIFDVAVDLRKDSITYGEWYGLELSEQNKKQLLIPRGFGHGFLVLSDEAIFGYKCDNYYNKASEGSIRFNCLQLNIKWPIIESQIITSKKDRTAPHFLSHKPI